jgi:hypothetical protein
VQSRKRFFEKFICAVPLRVFKFRSRLCRFSSALLCTGCRDFFAADDNVTNFQRVATERQTGAHPESTNGAVALHIDVGRSQVVFLQARLERRQIKGAVVGAKRVLQRNGQPITARVHVAACGVAGFRTRLGNRSDYAKSIFSHSCHLSISRKKGRESVVNSLRSSLKRFSKS